MNLEKLNPWNWFKHEEAAANKPMEVSESSAGPFDVRRDNPIVRLHQDLDRLFDQALRGFGFPSVWSNEVSRTFHPTLNVSSNDKTYQVSLELPGMSQSDIEIEVQGDALLIHGEKKHEERESDEHYYRVERRYGSFRRVLALPDDANAEEIKASMRDGVLELRIPRRATSKRDSKRITIS